MSYFESRRIKADNLQKGDVIIERHPRKGGGEIVKKYTVTSKKYEGIGRPDKPHVYIKDGGTWVYDANALVEVAV